MKKIKKELGEDHSDYATFLQGLRGFIELRKQLWKSWTDVSPGNENYKRYSGRESS
ncbi:MAG: hypothetical protein IPG99_15780 [Ignavibacteria bacterium]|nr:hypothetical protein [Ignavibacteria bacterium]